MCSINVFAIYCLLSILSLFFVFDYVEIKFVIAA